MITCFCKIVCGSPRSLDPNSDPDVPLTQQARSLALPCSQICQINSHRSICIGRAATISWASPSSQVSVWTQEQDRQRFHQLDASRLTYQFFGCLASLTSDFLHSGSFSVCWTYFLTFFVRRQACFVRWICAHELPAQSDAYH